MYVCISRTLSDLFGCRIGLLDSDVADSNVDFFVDRLNYL